MDPLTAVGFASNIVAFVDFTSKLLRAAHTLYVSAAGTTAENLELETLAEHLQLLAKKTAPTSQLRYSSQPLSKEDAALHDLATQCEDLSNQLLVILNSFKVQGRHKKWKSLYQAIRSSRHAAEIDAIQNRLDRIGAQMSSHLLLQRYEKLFEKLESMEAENRRQAINRSQDIGDLWIAMDNTFKQLRLDRDRNNQNMGSLTQIVTHAGKMLRYSHEQDVLRYLRFESMDDRQFAINPAHAVTYSWVFDNDSDFVNWLRSDDNLFWVSGKPGSGKSTFMKYASEHRLLIEHLKVWAGNQTMIVAHFFFWNLGRQQLHKSQEGLLRSILYQIFRQQPGLIVQAYPQQHSIGVASPPVGRELSKDTIPISELLAAVNTISDGLANSNSKYCFFIDGLDEYEGKPNDIISLVKLLKDTLQVKMCVSSRPWNEFEKVFGEDNPNKLYIQDLTRGDIEEYVRDTFERDSGFQEFLEDNDEETLETLDLVSDIVNGANGVFLWVRLVVQSLLEGITNADRVIDLRRRLHSMPKDLNDFFDRILFGVDNFYKQQTSHFFQVTLIAHVTLPLICYWYMDQEDDENDEPEYALGLAIQPLTVQRTTIRLKQMRKRLNACCKGLLEVQFYDSNEDNDALLASSVLFNWKVDFLHRTVRDFLRTPDMQEKLQTWAAPKFNADSAICGAILAQIKTAPQEEEYYKPRGPVEKLSRAFHHHIGPSRGRLMTEYSTTIGQQMSACGIRNHTM
ncbi:hypothetical protein GGS26DRAFT_575604 [Hypomontagnella submonticulosa]|nr:hypothetical protein GGS26DRAFT_575604 [Hypomontagnella submonticulosa]